MIGVPSTLNKLVTNPNGPGYVLSPWPSWEFNQINKTGSLQNCQSMIIDSNNLMWIIEVGRMNFADANPSLLVNGQAGLYVVNVTDGEKLHYYAFPDDVVPYNNSFVNDIVLDEMNGFAYLSNTWGNGGIIVFNMNTFESHIFTGPSTNRNSSYNFCVNYSSDEVCYGTDGIGNSPSDGIALSSDNSIFYYSSVQGNALYSIETSILQNFENSNIIFNNNAKFLGYKTGSSDGMLYLNGNLIYGDIQNSQISLLPDVGIYNMSNVVSISLSDHSISNSYSMNWLDTFSIDFNDMNTVYFTTNRLNLFLDFNMDFTGQSGANMRIFKANINLINQDYDATVMKSSSKLSIVYFIIVFVMIFLVIFIKSISYHLKIKKQDEVQEFLNFTHSPESVNPDRPSKSTNVIVEIMSDDDDLEERNRRKVLDIVDVENGKIEGNNNPMHN
jgi:hypothetical protein